MHLVLMQVHTDPPHALTLVGPMGLPHAIIRDGELLVGVGGVVVDLEQRSTGKRRRRGVEVKGCCGPRYRATLGSAKSFRVKEDS